MEEDKYAIALTRTNGIGDINLKRERQIKKITEIVNQEDFIICEGFESDAGGTDFEGQMEVIIKIIAYVVENPYVSHLVISHPTSLSRSSRNYQLFSSLLGYFGLTIVTPNLYKEQA